LEKIDEFIAKRRSIAHYYQKVLKDVPGITVGGEAEWAWNNYWLSWILVEADYGKSKDELLKELNDKRIEARAFFIPLHTLPPYRSYQAYQISKALELYDKGINLPSHTTLEKNVLNFVVDTIKNFAKN
jgi:perosamine synthetase